MSRISYQGTRGVIFDLGGTLIVSPTSEDANVAALLNWAASRGLPVPAEAGAVVLEERAWMWEETRRTGRQRTAREAILRTASRISWPTHEQFLGDATAAFFTPEVLTAAAYADAVSVLISLQNMDMRLGILSNASDQHMIEDVTMRTGLFPFVDPVLSSAAQGTIKPSREIFQTVLADWGIEAERCVMVGDDLEADVGGARALGMKAVLLDRNSATVSDSVVPDAVVRSLSEVPPLIQSWWPEPG